MAVVVPNNQRGEKFIEGIDVNDPEYIKELLRPPDIKEDVKLMQQRSRVSLILRSPYFRKDLEQIVASSLKSGCLNANIVALKQIIDYLTPQTRLGISTFTRGVTVPVVPINDLRLVQRGNYVKGERLLRCKLASVYRLVDIFGWNTGINNHITARVSRDTNEYLINPTGLLYNELTGSSLMKINLEGVIIDQGLTGLGIDKQGWLLHAAVYSARPDIRCIIHLSTPAAVAVSCTNTGLLPISQEAMILGETAIYDPLCILSTLQNGEMDAATRRESYSNAQRDKIAQIFSEKPQDCMLLLVRNHGLLAMGQSVEEAWFTAFTALLACEPQLRLASISADELILPSKEAQDAAHHVGRTPAVVQLRPGEVVGSSGWKRGELEFEALMRRLDAAGYRTGYVYRLSQVRQGATTASTLQRSRGDTLDSSFTQESVAMAEMSPRDAAAHVRRAASLGRGLRGLRDVEIPPTVSSFATTYYGDEESRAATIAEMKAKTLSLSRTHWSNTPNKYLREYLEEIGTPNPKKITHWIEGTDDNKSRTGGVAVPIIDRNQFALQGKNPHEFRTQQKKVKDKYYKDVKSAGPRSRILEGLDLDDDLEVTDAGSKSPKVVSPRGTLLRLDPSNLPALEPGHVVVVGAASKGIINRNQRHNAGVYQSVYSPNPFDRVTDEDLERYKENIDRKAKGLPSLEEEEERIRIEEARRAAEVARQAMEDAARREAQEKLNEVHLTSSFKVSRTIRIPDYASTLADINTNILSSSATSACLTGTDRSLTSLQPQIRFDFEHDNMSISNPVQSLDTFSGSVLPTPSVTEANKTVENGGCKSPLRRRSALRYSQWPKLISDSVTVATMTDISKVSMGNLQRNQTFTVSYTSCRSNNAMCTTESQLRPSFPSSNVNNLLLSEDEAECSDDTCAPSEFSFTNHVSTLDVDRTHAIRSDTSGAEASHDDTEKEMKKDEVDGVVKKKKRRFKIPSFALKSKSKDTKEKK